MEDFRIFPDGEIFHICNKSISNYHIFRTDKLRDRFITALNYYNNSEINISLSRALRNEITLNSIFSRNKTCIIFIIAYCIMPDHYHLLAKINQSALFSKYINNLQSSFTRFYNKMHDRKGPLWQSRFKAIKIPDDYTLLHVHRYIHLNPTTSGLVARPNDWIWSSYPSYLSDGKVLSLNKEVSIQNVHTYKKFVEDQIDYQKKIKGIRRILLEDERRRK